MKKYIISFLLLVCLISPFKIIADDEIFIEFEDGLSGINLYDFNSTAEERYKKEDFEFTDITNDAKKDESLINKINEYGTLIRAFNINYKGTDNLDDAFSTIVYYFDYEEELYKNLSTLIKNEDDIIPVSSEEYLYYNDKYIEEYELDEKEHHKIACVYRIDKLEGTFYIIIPKKETIEQDNIKITYDLVKNPTLSDNYLFFDSINNVLNKDKSYNESYIQSLAALKGLDFYEDFGMDPVLEELKTKKDSLENQINKTKNKLIDMYGIFFVDKNWHYTNLLSNIDSPVNISIKLDEKLKNYSDYNVYIANPNGYVEIDTGVFEDGTSYYRKKLNDEGDVDYEYLYGTSDESYYIYGEDIPSNKILESSEDYGYRLPTSNVFLDYYDDPNDKYYGYYYYDGEDYVRILGYSAGDSISNYEETNQVTVLIHDEFVLTTDTVFLRDKSYVIANELDYTLGPVDLADYKVGSNIADSKETIYIDGYSIEPIKDPVTVKNGYINFIYDTDENLYYISLIMISGKEIKDYSKNTTDNNFRINFKEVEGLTFKFFVDDFEKYTNEQSQKELTKSTKSTSQMVNFIKDKLISDEVISIYNITLQDTTDKKYTEGPFEFKIKKTKEMSNYKNLKLINISTDDSGNLIRNEIVELTDDGEYLTGNLPHLSVYALSGSINGIPVEIISSENGSIDNGNDSFTLTDDIGEYILCNIKDSKLTFYPQDKSKKYEYNAIPNENYEIEKWTYRIGNGEEIEIKDNTKIMKSDITDKIVFTAYFKETIKPNPSNPKTYDNGITFIIGGLISLVCLTLSTIYLKKRKFN